MVHKTRVEELEVKIDEKNDQLCKMLKQKQMDAKEISELKFKVEREINLNNNLSTENE